MKERCFCLLYSSTVMYTDGIHIHGSPSSSSSTSCRQVGAVRIYAGRLRATGRGSWCFGERIAGARSSPEGLRQPQRRRPCSSPRSSDRHVQAEQVRLHARKRQSLSRASQAPISIQKIQGTITRPLYLSASEIERMEHCCTVRCEGNTAVQYDLRRNVDSGYYLLPGVQSMDPLSWCALAFGM